MSVNAVDELAKSASNPVTAIAESGILTHSAATGANIRLLVNLLNLASVELECLGRVSAKDKHVSAAELDTCHGLRAHELSIGDLELGPLLACDCLTVFSAGSITFEN